MALNQQFYTDMVNRMKASRISLDKLIIENNDTTSYDESTNGDRFYQEILDVDMDAIDPDDIDPEDMEGAALNMAFTSTIDNVTQRHKIRYSYFNEKHKRATNQLLSSIVNYISASVPVAANMTPDEFLVYVTDFYASQLASFNDGVNDLTTDVMEFHNIRFPADLAFAAISEIERFAKYADNFDSLKSTCQPLAAISEIDKNRRMDIFKGFASVLTTPEKTPGNN